MKITRGLMYLCRKVHRGDKDHETVSYKDHYLVISKTDSGILVTETDIIDLLGYPEGTIYHEFEVAEEDL